MSKTLIGRVVNRQSKFTVTELLLVVFHKSQGREIVGDKSDKNEKFSIA